MSNQSDRFHALDATRAFALLLGVVFHAAWSFCPVPLGGPIVDRSANEGFYWFFFTSHTFRMQLFFLIAGFFGHLLFHRRGFCGFVRHRLLRIGVPLVAGWLILFPSLVMAWTLGGNLSGRNLTEIPLPFLFVLMFKYLLMFIPRSMGGLFSMGHLWFLYYLLWIYALTLALRLLLARFEGLNTRADGWIARMMRSRWSIVWLSVGMGLFLWPMSGWFGVDTPAHWVVPSVPVLVFYGLFFAIGWLLHRQASLLAECAGRWRWQLALGLVLSVPVFLVFRVVQNQGVTGTLLAHYPGFEATQFKDWPGFLTRLQAANNSGAVPVELANLWQQLAPAAREKVLPMTATSGPDLRSGVAETINSLLPRPEMFTTAAIQPATPPPPAAIAKRALIENRATLERIFGATLAGNPTDLSWYRPAKLAYSCGYGLVMWLLIFGTLGAFQERCRAHSAAWRYVADASYWIYLVHLPLVPLLQIWVAPWAWPAILKFLFLTAVAFVILFATYHCFVRSTFIGMLLNGRTYPFVAWPFGKSETRLETMPAQAQPLPTPANDSNRSSP